MRARYKVVLQGFSEFERNALTFCLKLTGEREPAYEPVPKLARTDFVIADADQAGVIDTIVEAGRTGVTVFVGRNAPADARSHISRPIDPTLIVRELDQLLAARTSEEETVAAVDVRPPQLLETPQLIGSDSDEVPTVPSRLDELPPARFEPSPEVDPEQATIAAPLQHDDDPPSAPAPPLLLIEPPEPVAVPTFEPVPEPVPIPSFDPVPEPQADAPMTVDERVAAKAAARAAARRARLAAAPQSAASHPPDALVLDDSEIAQVYLCRLLSDFGFRPHPVQSGAEALDLLARQPFAVVFLDVQLEAQDEHDGIDLCHLIKQEPMSPDGSVPVVVVVSGQARPADKVRAGLAGCDVFLSKPLSRGDVARALESCGVALPSDARRRS